MRDTEPRLFHWPAVGSPSNPPRRTFDPILGMDVVRLHPGDYYATGADNEIISTILGSCVAACVRNPYLGYGGMNHFMLPRSDSGEWGGAFAALRYGNYAMEILINAVLKTGCPRHDLEIKLFGGADFFSGPMGVGEQNARFALRYLEIDGLRARTVDLGGNHPRIIHYRPATGIVRRKLLEQPRRRVLDEERRYQAKLIASPPEGDVELFT